MTRRAVTALAAIAALAWAARPSPSAAQSPGLLARQSVPDSMRQQDVPVRPWLVAGPFPVDTGPPRLTSSPLPTEASLLPNAGESTGAPDSLSATARAWRAVTADTLGRIDFNALFDGATSNAAAYAATYVVSPEDRTVTLALRSDDDLRLWLNDRLVWDHPVARGIDTSEDTVVVRLAKGPNRLLAKAVNRTGGFGLGVRVLAGAAVTIQLHAAPPIADLAFQARRPPGARADAAPAPSLTVGPVALGAGAHLDADGLRVPLEVSVTRWGGYDTQTSISVGGAGAAVPDSDRATLLLDAAWADLAREAGSTGMSIDESLTKGTRVGDRRWTVHGAGSELLDLLARPVAIDRWRATRDAAGPDAPADAWIDLEPRADSTATRDPAITAIATDLRVPAELAGLTLLLDAAEFDPATIRVDGAPARPDSLGRIDLCRGPCRAGTRLHVGVATSGDTWWDPPHLVVADPGWFEIHAGARWAAAFAPDVAPPIPGAETVRALAAAAVRPDKQRYHALVQKGLDALAPAAARVRRDTIDVVGNSHIDAAWLWRWAETVDVVKHTWGTAVKLMDKYPEMRFAASAARYYVWLDSVAPDTLAQIRRLVDDGRWALVGGWWVEPDANLPSGESLVRQGLYGQRTFQRIFGRMATVGWIPDTFGYSWQLPQIMAGQGLEFFVTQKLRWNDTNPWPARLNLFWWQGRDGSRILTYIPYGYDHELRGEELERQWKATSDSSAVRAMLTLYGVGDHGGGPTMTMLERKRSLSRLSTFPTLKNELPSAVLGAMRDRIGTTGPVVDDELYLEYHRGVYTTQAAMKAWNRRMEALLPATEAAAVLAADRAGHAYPTAALDDAWKKTLFNQFHDLLPGSGIAEIYADAKKQYAEAEAEADAALDEALRAVAGTVAARAPLPHLTPYLVFNPTGRDRSGEVVLVPLAGDAALDAPQNVGVFDGDGRRLPSARRGDTIVARVGPVPATGALVVYAGPARRDGRPIPTRDSGTARPNGAPAILRNEHLEARVDPGTGDVAITDLDSGRALFSGSGNRLYMIHDQPSDWDAWNIDDLDGARTPLDRNVRVGPVMRDALGQSVTVHREADSVSVDQRYVLRDGEARVTVETTVDWHASHELLVAAFPLALSPDSVWAEIAYGAIGRPNRAVTSKDSARFEVPMQRWIDASADGFGVALANDGKYGYDAKGDTVRLSLLRAPKWPDPGADMGVHHFRYAIVPHDGDWRSEAVWQAAEDLNDPLRAVPLAVTPSETEDAGAPSGTRGAGAASVPGFVALEGAPGVELGALKRAEDGDGTVIRLVERYGRPEDVTARFRGPVVLQPTDLLERPAGAAVRSAPDGTVRLHLDPWKIRTWKVRPGT